MVSLSGCASLRGFFVPEVADKDARIEWQKTMKFSVNGKMYRGIAVLPNANTFNLKIYPADKTIDRFQWRTCEGADFQDKVIKTNFWGKAKKKYHEMNITPTKIEQDRACTMKLESLSGKHKVMEFGWIIFPDSREEVNIPAVTECSRQTTPGTGKSACQAPMSSVYRIGFADKVYQDIEDEKACPPLNEIDQNRFEGYMPIDECLYLFMSLERHSNGKRREHILHTYGWEKSPPPEY